MKVKPDNIKPTDWGKQLSSDVDPVKTSPCVTSLKGDIIYDYKRHTYQNACEGVKKAASVLSIAIVAIAIPSVYNGFSQPKETNGNKTRLLYIIPELKILAQADREILFCFDQDSKRQTRWNTNQAIRKTANLFIKSGWGENTCSPQRKYSKKRHRQKLTDNFSWATSKIVGGGSNV